MYAGLSVIALMICPLAVALYIRKHTLTQIAHSTYIFYKQLPDFIKDYKIARW
jgi:hypothetical protein